MKWTCFMKTNLKLKLCTHKFVLVLVGKWRFSIKIIYFSSVLINWLFTVINFCYSVKVYNFSKSNDFHGNNSLIYSVFFVVKVCKRVRNSIGSKIKNTIFYKKFTVENTKKISKILFFFTDLFTLFKTQNINERKVYQKAKL